MCHCLHSQPSFTRTYIFLHLTSSPIFLPRQKLSDTVVEEMVIFRHDAHPTVLTFFVCLDLPLSTRPVETTIRALPRLNICTASVVKLFRENNSCGGRSLKNRSYTLRFFLLGYYRASGSYSSVSRVLQASRARK